MKARLKELRKALHITQAGLADEIKVSKPTIEAYEYGRTEIPERSITAICKAFNVNENWLRTGEGEMFNPKDFDEEVTDIVWSIVDKKSLSEEERNQYIELIKIISSTGAEDIDLLLRVAKRFNKNNPL